MIHLITGAPIPISNLRQLFANRLMSCSRSPTYACAVDIKTIAFFLRALLCSCKTMLIDVNCLINSGLYEIFEELCM